MFILVIYCGLNSSCSDLVIASPTLAPKGVVIPHKLISYFCAPAVEVAIGLAQVVVGYLQLRAAFTAMSSHSDASVIQDLKEITTFVIDP